MKRALVFATVLLTNAAHAQSRLGGQGSTIQTSNYSVDLFQGPVLATARITGLGGAYVAIAEGTEGIAFNPAAVSLRPVYSTTYVDYDLTAGATLPSSVNGTDFDNDGRKGFKYNNFIWGVLGGTLQIGKLGIGAVLSGQNYSLGAPSGGPALLPGGAEAIDGLTVRVFRLDAVASYGFFDEQLHVGAGPRLASLFGVGDGKKVLPSKDGSVTLGDDVGERLLFGTTGIGAQGGALWTPRTLPMRAGLAIRSPIVSSTTDSGSRIKQDANGNRVIGNFFLPNSVSLPWEVEMGHLVPGRQARVQCTLAERGRAGRPRGRQRAPQERARRLPGARVQRRPPHLAAASRRVASPARAPLGVRAGHRSVGQRGRLRVHARAAGAALGTTRHVRRARRRRVRGRSALDHPARRVLRRAHALPGVVGRPRPSTASFRTHGHGCTAPPASSRSSSSGTCGASFPRPPSGA